MRLLTLIIAAIFSQAALAQFASDWDDAKNKLDDKVYNANRHTFYCGCDYTSDGDDDGSGDIVADDCGLGTLTKWLDVRDMIQWEHIMPANLMSVGTWQCWINRSEIDACHVGGDPENEKLISGRDCCEKVSPSGEMMMLDLHNLAPAAAQLNQHRSNQRYGIVKGTTGAIRMGTTCNAYDSPNGSATNLFEPPDCKKGDVARVWLYMETAHGAPIPAAEKTMLLQWSQNPLGSHARRGNRKNTGKQQPLCRRRNT